MRFGYDSLIRDRFLDLRTGLLEVDGIGSPSGGVADVTAPFLTQAKARLAAGTESEFVEIQAFRRAFAAMGLKPTQYRCASEALLRRFRKEGALPALNPMVDVCNAVSLAFAIPVAAFYRARISGDLIVRPARGDEIYQTFSGTIETPDAGEIIFADEKGTAHARRWTNRQSGASAVGPETEHILIVAEALHEGAGADIAGLVGALNEAILRLWPAAAISVREVS